MRFVNSAKGFVLLEFISWVFFGSTFVLCLSDLLLVSLPHDTIMLDPDGGRVQ